MKNYEKPVVLLNEELAEGVYTASGCWSFTVSLTTNNDVTSEVTGCEVQINGTHTNPEQHLAYPIFTINFNQPILNVTSSSGPTTCTFSGNTVVVGWNIGTYNSTEEKGYAIRVSVADPATLAITSWSYTCPN